MMSQKKQPWGNYPKPAHLVHLAESQADIEAYLQNKKETNKTTLCVGNGRSYGDSYLAKSGHAIQAKGMDDIISFDLEYGTLRAQAGITIAKILDIIVPQGWFLPVTPGTKFATLGGAVANDVHGKNHHIQGTFGSCVRRLGLRRSNGEIIECSADENVELFAATISGLGLTGIILWVEIDLKPINSNAIETKCLTFNTVEEFVTQSKLLESEFEYVLAWIDYRTKNIDHCRGIVFAGRHANSSVKDLSRHKLKIPFTPFISLINRLSTTIFNHLYYTIHAQRKDVALVHYDKFFYPLDNINMWNRIYGPNGFQQYQCVIPQEHAVITIKKMLKAINNAKTGSFLSALKVFGENKSFGLISFPMPGLSLAIDFPNSKKLDGLFQTLDDLVHSAGGRLYPAKDAHMKSNDFKKGYSNWENLERLRDPSMMSRFWHKILNES